MNSPDGLDYGGGELELFARAVHWKAYLCAQLAPWLGGRVLEVGAGLGATTAMLATLPHAAWLCLEPDPAMAETLRDQAASGTLPPLTLAGATIADLAAAERFDTILYVDVLEHIADDHGELARAAGHLAPGGHLLVLSPAHQALYSAFDRSIGHFRRYDRASLRAAAPAGLELRRLAYLDSVGMLASLANRWLLRKPLPAAADIALWDRVMVPVSRRLDPLLGYRLGKSILGVWHNPA
jgi:SAM-dependent methyltransferase